MKHVLLNISLAVVLAISTYAQTKLSLKQQWAFGGLGDNLGKGGLLVKDLDKNGFPDIIVLPVQVIVTTSGTMVSFRCRIKIWQNAS